MDEAKTSKEFNFESSADREKLSDNGKSTWRGYDERIEIETREEEKNFEKFYDQRVRAAEDEMLRQPELSRKGGPAFTIDGRQPRPNSVWKREDLSPQQQQQLRGTAEQQVKEDHTHEIERIKSTYKEAQRALLDRELGPKRYERDRSYRDV